MKKIILSTLLLSLTSVASANKFSYFPTKINSWRTVLPQDAGFDPEKLDKLMEYIRGKNKEYKTDGFLILKDGHIVQGTEYYSKTYDPYTSHYLWSFSKSLANGILGAAEKQGVLNRDSKVADYVKGLHPGSKDLTMRHLLNMSSGLHFFEEHPVNIILSNTIYMTYSWYGYKDMMNFIIKRPFANKPGAKFNYSTGDGNLAMGVLHRAFQKKYPNNKRVAQRAYNDFPYQYLFDKIGMSNTIIEQDGTGLMVAGAFGWSTPRDMARFAMLYMNHGIWDDQDVFTGDWVDFSVNTVAPALNNHNLKEQDELRLNREAYGAYWWLNRSLPMNSGKLPYPNLPHKAYQAMGYRGQTMAILPEQNIILVRLGADHLGKAIDRYEMYRLLRESYVGRNNWHKSEGSEVTEEGIFDYPEINDKILDKENFKKIVTVFERNFDGQIIFDDTFAMAPAKDLCSCVFVAKQKLNYCIEEHPQVPMFLRNGLIKQPKIINNKNEKSIEVSNKIPYTQVIFGGLTTHRAKALFINKKLGCMISDLTSPWRFPEILKFWGDSTLKPEIHYFDGDFSK